MTDVIKSHPVPFAVLVTVAGGPLLGPNPDRIALTFNAPPTNRYSLFFGPLGAIDTGVTMYPTNDPWTVDSVFIGDGLQSPISAISVVADQTVTGVEWIRAR